jgi:hypothetical protein
VGAPDDGDFDVLDLSRLPPAVDRMLELKGIADLLAFEETSGTAYPPHWGTELEAESPD